MNKRQTTQGEKLRKVRNDQTKKKHLVGIPKFKQPLKKTKGVSRYDKERGSKRHQLYMGKKPKKS